MVRMHLGALLVLQQMALLGVWPDVISFNSAISACGKQMQWQVALAPWQGISAAVASEALLQQMRFSVSPNVVSVSAGRLKRLLMVTVR